MYPKQLSTLSKLEDNTRSWIRKNIENRAADRMAQEWSTTRSQIRDHISSFWKRYSLRGQSLSSAKYGIELHMVRNDFRKSLETFTGNARQLITVARNQAYANSYLRSAWMLDQVTPPNIEVKFDHTVLHRLKESDYRIVKRNVSRLREADDKKDAIKKITPEDRASAFVTAYETSLWSTFMLGLMSGRDEGQLRSAAGNEPVSYPAQRMENYLDTLIHASVIQEVEDGVEDLGDENDDIIDDWIWQSREDGSVCEDCAANDQQRRSEVDDDIPLHPWCRCYWRLVPKGWDSLYDRDIPGQEGSMVVMGPDGRPAAFLTVAFDQWIAKN